MNRYQIEMIETLTRVVYVDALTPAGAYTKLRGAYEQGSIELDAINSNVELELDILSSQEIEVVTAIRRMRRDDGYFYTLNDGTHAKCVGNDTNGNPMYVRAETGAPVLVDTSKVPSDSWWVAVLLNAENESFTVRVNAVTFSAAYHAASRAGRKHFNEDCQCVHLEKEVAEYENFD